MAAVLAILALLSGFPSASLLRRDVLELEDADFDYHATGHETMLVMFYAPWCGHCKKLSPEFEKAATRLKGSVQLAKVDCTSNTESCSRFAVSGFPTLKIFRNGRDSAPYDGPRSADGIHQFMMKQTGPDSVLLKTDEDIQTFINHHEASIVGVFQGPQQAEFLRAASLLRDQFRFAHTVDLKLAEPYGSSGECVLLFRSPRLASKFEDGVVVLRDHLTVSSLRRFIRDNIYGLCPVLTVENRDRLRVRDLLTAFYDVDYRHNVAGSNYWRNRVMKVASSFCGRGLTFSVANRRDFLSELEDDFGLRTSDGELPVVTIRTKLGHKYTMREEFTRDGQSLTRFLDDFFSGRLKRFIKSEPPPERNTAGVKVVVAESFDDIVNDPDKDVLIQFHSRSCSRCKKLEPVFRELADTVSSDPNIVIATMDAANNDVPLGYHIQGFPTIYFVPVGKKDEPIRYEGGLELKDFLKFLKNKARTKTEL